MKHHFLSAIGALCLTSTMLAAPAVPGTLADYLALGPGGTTIGSTVFSNFTLLPLQTGATQIPPSSILVTPINLFNNPGLQFTVNTSAGPGQLFELRIGYQVADTSITGASVFLTGATVGGPSTEPLPPGFTDPAITATTDLSAPGTPTLIAFAIPGLADLDDETTFGSVALLSVETDIVIDGGAVNGAAPPPGAPVTASLASATNQFVVAQAPGAAVPEPGTALAGLAALALCGVRRRRRTPALC
jgi:hypothetical protein